MQIRAMRQLLGGVSRDEFGKRYNIPKRSIENWEQEKSKCPTYVQELLERAVLDDRRALLSNIHIVLSKCGINSSPELVTQWISEEKIDLYTDKSKHLYVIMQMDEQPRYFDISDEKEISESAFLDIQKE